MHIAMIAPPWYEIPPTGYGGIEAMCADLSDGLVDRGHKVTLISAGRNGTRAHQLRTYDRPQSDRLGSDPLPEVVHLSRANRLIADLDVDVVHDHTLSGPLSAGSRPAPTVVTVHSPVEGEEGEYYEYLGDSVRLVAISQSQRSHRPDLSWVATVHNGLDPGRYPFHAEKDDFVVWLGRFTPEKGPNLAVHAAREAGVHLVLAGKCSESAEEAYLDSEIRPHLTDGVRLVLDADRDAVGDLLSRARCLLLPVRWEEPFGMVLIEAMACGTPVVTLRRGAIPEIVEHGVTGYVLDDPAELPEALTKAGDLDRHACRRRVEEQFSTAAMAAGYERAYQAALRS